MSVNDEQPSRPRRATRSSEELRERVRQEAMKLIAASGYRGISVAEVAAAVGISKQALLYHFPTKQALYFSVLDTVMLKANEGLTRLVDALLDDGAHRLEEGIRLFTDGLETEPYAAAVVLRALLDGDEAHDRIRAASLHWAEPMQKQVEEAQQRGHLKPDIDAQALVAQMATVILASLAVIRMDEERLVAPGWKLWRERRIRETVRTLELLLHG